MFKWNEKKSPPAQTDGDFFSVEMLHATPLLCNDLSLFQAKFAVNQVNVLVGLNPSIPWSWQSTTLNQHLK